jgi:hypothetical protein
MWCKIFNFKLIVFHHIILYKNLINEFFFMKLRNYLLWNKFQYMKVQKNDAMTSKNGHFKLANIPWGWRFILNLGAQICKWEPDFDLRSSQMCMMGVFILVLRAQMVLVLEVKMFWSWMLNEVYFGLGGSNNAQCRFVLI